MTKLLLSLIGAAVLATAGYAATSAFDDSEPARTVSLPGATTGGTTTDEPGDISGPCDEAEHRNDPRCAGIVPTDPAPGTTTDDDDGDISGPCDEAEHRNDPRCTGGVETDDDRSGPGRGRGDDRDRDDDDRDDRDDEDRSGPNRGPG